MKIVSRILQGIARFLSYFSIISTAIMILLSVADVIARNIFGHPITGATEMVQIFNVGTILAMGMGCLTGQNVSVDFVMDALPNAPRHIITIIMNLITTAVLGIVVWRSIVTAIDYSNKGYGYTLLNVPHWPFVVVVAVGFFGGACATIFLTINEARELAGKEPYKIPGLLGDKIAKKEVN
ncbi:MAG: TRAP transporter small permease [Parasporobacterium sp.]|nr:TRAP transporter small permease [Parasporobacterium sp.]